MQEHGDPTDLVAAGYDTMSGWYADVTAEGDYIRDRYVQLAIDRLPRSSEVLDLGCGPGIPATKRLSEKFQVTGVDVSKAQLSTARASVPEASFIQSDMTKLDLDPGSFDAVTAFYSIIHVPRDRQPSLFESIHSWLRPEGLLIVAMARSATEAGFDPNWGGAPMYWSHFDAETNEKMIDKAGFNIETATLETKPNPFDDDSDTETFLWIVATA